MRSADGILMVVREGTTQKRQLQRGLQALEQSKLLGVVLNSSTNTDHDNYYQRYAPLTLKSAAKSKSDTQRRSVVQSCTSRSIRPFQLNSSHPRQRHPAPLMCS